MQRIQFKKDGSKMIKLGKTWYRPLNLEQILNLQSTFYAGTAVREDGEKLDDIEKPISKWFNYKGLTYVKA